MFIFQRQVALKQHLKKITDLKTTIGFVPTMGALHNGHLSLIENSLKNNSFTIVSIFVNPTQFNSSEDLEKYPRTLDSDLQKLESLDNSILVYVPNIADIYNGKAVSNQFDFDGLEDLMEGKFRPGHFDGVGTIVKRLFEITNPTNAYFGEKDFQQLQIIRKLAEKEKLPVKIISCPIFREINGLAMSSRNERLSLAERKSAEIIYNTLLKVKVKFNSESFLEIKKWVTEVFKNQNVFELEYFEIADEATLLKCENKNSQKKYRAFVAVYVNNIRLIDTISLN